MNAAWILPASQFSTNLIFIETCVGPISYMGENFEKVVIMTEKKGGRDVMDIKAG